MNGKKAKRLRRLALDMQNADADRENIPKHMRFEHAYLNSEDKPVRNHSLQDRRVFNICEALEVNQLVLQPVCVRAYYKRLKKAA